MKNIKLATQEQINEIVSLQKTIGLTPFTMDGLTFERAERIIKEIKANWGE